jgi:hypothetical protein
MLTDTEEAIRMLVKEPDPKISVRDIEAVRDEITVIHLIGMPHRRTSYRPAPLIGVYLIGVHLADVHLIDVYLVGVHLLQACILQAGISYRHASLTGVHLTGAIS